jgi:hypothetical protein
MFLVRPTNEPSNRFRTGRRWESGDVKSFVSTIPLDNTSRRPPRNYHFEGALWPLPRECQERRCRSYGGMYRTARSHRKPLERKFSRESFPKKLWHHPHIRSTQLQQLASTFAVIPQRNKGVIASVVKRLPLCFKQWWPPSCCRRSASSTSWKRHVTSIP